MTYRRKLSTRWRVEGVWPLLVSESLTDTLVFVTNLPSEVTVDKLKTIFPGAKNIFLRKESPSYSPRHHEDKTKEW